MTHFTVMLLIRYFHATNNHKNHDLFNYMRSECFIAMLYASYMSECYIE